jgi:CRISPR-associated protein Csx17
MPETILTGCTPTPLAHYLKALAILRVVAEQKDENATGRWDGEHFVLHSALDLDGLERFFLYQYQPTPIVAPWNGGSGFYAQDNQTGIASLETGVAGRFLNYRTVIALCRAVVACLQLVERPKEGHKASLLARVRQQLPDRALSWFDAAVLLVDDEPRYPPLLGTGGNDGRLDFTNNFMQRIVELFNADSGLPTALSHRWLSGSLFRNTIPGMTNNAIGQFSPGGVGGPNASTGFEGGSLVNPWDFVLMMEGALLFAAAATRRLESTAPGALSYPFTVNPTGIGSGAVSLGDEVPARAEIWSPLWGRPAGLDEVRMLMTEGRATVGRRPARDGLDFARSLAALGVDRGIDSFQRHALLRRSGKAYLATPISRLLVRRNPDADLISDLDSHGYLDRLRRFARSDSASGRIKQLARVLEDKLFALTRWRSSPGDLQAILSTLGSLQYTAGISAKACEDIPPIPSLSGRWVTMADDKSDEYRIACALASLWAPDMPMRAHLAPVDLRSNAWLNQNGKLFVWGSGRLVANLVRVLERRLLEAARRGFKDKPLDGALPADLAAVLAFLTGATDDNRISRMLTGLVLTTMPDDLPDRHSPDHHVPAGFSVLTPLFTTDRLLRWLGFLPADARLPLPLEIVAKLSAGQADDAVRLAWKRLRIAELGLPSFPHRSPSAKGMDGPRLAAALLIPLRAGDVGRLCRRLPMTRAEGYAFETT